MKNGLDYLVSVVKHLDETESEVTPSDVKYAVLHLQAAVEVLFKTRLLAEHWTLVFTHPGDATRKALDEATLKSVTPEQAITRLQNIAGVEISDKEAKTLTRLTTDRNKLQHFGFTDNARAVEARAGEVLDFLIRFIDTELQPYLEPADRLETESGLGDLREGLGNINSYVRKRMNRIAGELRKEGVESTTIECPACENVTLVLDEGPRCRQPATAPSPPAASAPAFSSSGALPGAGSRRAGTTGAVSCPPTALLAIKRSSAQTSGSAASPSPSTSASPARTSPRKLRPAAAAASR